MSPVRAFALAAVTVLSLGALGCDDGVTPVLSDFRFDGAAPDSPLVLLLSVAFHDGDGDLGVDRGGDERGRLETFIDERPTQAGALSLAPLFLESELAPEATDGTVRFVLELAFGDNAPPAGSTFSLGCRATDAARNSSSTQQITIKIDY